MIIDATDIILGRLASFAAKQALLGQQVIIVNCEKAMISGSKENILARYKRKRNLGTPRTGMFLSRKPAFFVKRVIRGMLPHRMPRGREALNRIRVYQSMPEGLKEKVETIKYALVSKLTYQKYMSVERLLEELGGR